ncbi:oxidoreductase [Novosphingobium sp.]|uniref:oxidoreductase n=1 Tax=Novosphingobium sp. TaxID=1874826 RepID=UPI0038B9ADB1
MTIRAALIGFGYAGKTFHAPLINATHGLELAVVASSDAAKVHAVLAGVVVEPDPLAAIARADIDLVVIATPNPSHAPLARAAIAAGKAVVVDKPMALDLAEARELVALAKAANVPLWVFHNRRWDSDFLTVRQAIDDGLLGTVAHFESHFDRFRPHVRDRWRENAGPGSGVWQDLGPHLVDQALHVFGLPDRVTASFARQRPGSAATDWAHVVLEYPQLRCILHAGMLVAGGSPRFVVHGTAGSLIKTLPDRQEAQLLEGLTPRDEAWGLDADPAVLHTPQGTHAIAATRGDQSLFYHTLVQSLAHVGIGPIRPIEALATTAVVEAAELSANNGKSVIPALTGAERESYALQ